MPLFFIALFVGFGTRQLRKSTQVPVLFRRLWLLGIALGLQVGLLPALRGAPRRAVLFISLAAAMAWLVDNVVRTNNKALRGAPVADHRWRVYEHRANAGPRGNASRR